jgi:hypothetical protein
MKDIKGVFWIPPNSPLGHKTLKLQLFSESYTTGWFVLEIEQNSMFW